MRTRQSYGEAIGLLTAFLRTHGMPTAPEAISREHLTAWVNGMLATRKAATAANRYRGASRFFISCPSRGRVVSEPAREVWDPVSTGSRREPPRTARDSRRTGIVAERSPSDARPAGGVKCVRCGQLFDFSA